MFGPLWSPSVDLCRKELLLGGDGQSSRNGSLPVQADDSGVKLHNFSKFKDVSQASSKYLLCCASWSAPFANALAYRANAATSTASCTRRSGSFSQCCSSP